MNRDHRRDRKQLAIFLSASLMVLMSGTSSAAESDAGKGPVLSGFSQAFAGGSDAESDDAAAGIHGAPKELPAADPRDFNGLWKPGITPRKRPLQHLDDAFLLEDPPLRPNAQALVEQYRAIKLSGRLPALSTHVCRSPGIYTTLFPAFVTSVVQTTDTLFIMFEQPRLVRRIRLNADHPVAPSASYVGDSVGRWEGNTLVVDTVGYNGLGELDISGAPVSRHAHMIERYTKSSDGKAIQILITVEDPEYLAEPLSVERRWVLAGSQQQGEFDCEENPREDMSDQTVYLDKRYEPVCFRVEGKAAEPSRVICSATTTH